jgi:prepilin-type N-terminal cleavage/methylation domain-containing protein
MTSHPDNKTDKGFSLIELIVAMTIMLAVMAIASSLLFRGFAIRQRESRTTDALTSAQAALRVISRDIANAGFGMFESADTKVPHNGIVIANSNANRIRVRSNLDNSGGLPGTPGASTLAINAPDEDVTYYFDSATSSIIRHDPNGGGTGTPKTSFVVNRISNVTFQYFDYAGLSSLATGPLSTPTANTGRVVIVVEVVLEPVAGQPSGQTIKLSSEVTLRNNSYMLQQY